MTRINTNVPSLVAQNRLQTSNKDLQTALTRLSTGLRINSGADDPAGLIASEALRSEITSLGKAISNTNRASQIISTADSALGEVSSLLNDIRGLVVEAANSGALSDDEIAANQLQIDSSLEAINRIAQTTTFQGRKLLDGSLDFVSNAGSVDSLTDINIDQANLGATGQIDAEVVISAAATRAEVTAGGFSTAATASAETTDVRVATQPINGENLVITGAPDFATIAFVDDTSASSEGSAAFDADTGVLTITGNFTGDSLNPGEIDADADAQVIQAAINSLAGFTATGAAAAGTPADPAGTAATVGAAEAGLTVTATVAGAEYNNVAVKFVSGAANGADFDSEQKILTVTVDNTQLVTADDIATAIGAATVDGATPTDAAFSAVGAAGAVFDINEGIDDANTASTGGEVLTDTLVFQLNGASGAETFNFGAGTSASQISAALNLVSDSTGVNATFSTAEGLKFTSTAYGSDALVHIDVISEGPAGTFGSSLSSLRQTGTDIEGTVNGVEAGGSANTLQINTSSLDLTLTVEDGSSENFSFSITDGGALFQLGPDVTSNQQARLGIGSVSTGQIGGPTGRLYELGSGQSKSLVNDVTGAAKIIDEVIGKVTGLRGRLGAFQATTLESNLVSLNETRSNLLEAESSIRDADFAQESANLTRAQILTQSGTNVLSLANQNPQNVLSLLG
ncbi:B-type flagellin [Rubripirellula lacrimiformis]|uniref:Flagellin n=1 Tax=Rubripirellula lacrimiformis TaxID=1930273 RepID=A0A517NBQ3_9BACT|nr:flagellin [Rubripirellula lacrimiformis]QDT04550.1 B-type flagellin [Rubripirellula lacrimiformis]